MSKLRRPDFLIKEIENFYAQENWYKLKLYLDALQAELLDGNSGGSLTPGTGGSTPTTPNTSTASKVMNCAATVSVGDWVYQSLSTDNFAVEVTNNNPPQPVIGKVIEKPSTTQATVVFSGVVSDSVARGRVFLGDSGESTITPPTLGFVQRLGVSFGDGQMMVNPELHRVKKV